LYITDEHHHRVSIFDTAGTFLGKWGSAGSAPGALNGPAGIAIDSTDAVYIADQYNHRIQKFRSDGTYVLHWGEAGNHDGQFNLPWGLAVDTEGDVYVADWRNDRIQKFTSEGRFIASFGEPGQGEGQFHRPSSVAVDDEGYIYVADWGNERVQVLAPDGSFELLLRGQATLSKWAEDYFAANPEEWQTRTISNLTPDLPPSLQTPYHISSQTEPYFWGPVSVTLDRENRLYVAETNRHRVQIYQKR
jgi:DNA-binding beta-propeller fold protein YncE